MPITVSVKQTVIKVNNLREEEIIANFARICFIMPHNDMSSNKVNLIKALRSFLNSMPEPTFDETMRICGLKAAKEIVETIMDREGFYIYNELTRKETRILADGNSEVVRSISLGDLLKSQIGEDS